MSDFNWNVIIPVVIALIAAIPGILSLWKGRKKENADAAGVLIGSSLALLKEVKEKGDKAELDIRELKKNLKEEKMKFEAESSKQQKEIGSLQTQVDQLNDQILRYRKTQGLLIRGIKILIKQLEENKINPNWNIDIDEFTIVEQEQL